MPKKSKQARAREFSPKIRQEILYRDNASCIFCRIGYHMEGATWLAKDIKSIMHYIPRAKGGLGIPQNGAVGCQHHHEMMDNGNHGRRQEMLGIFRSYLMEQYPDWNEEELVYSKWK